MTPLPCLYPRSAADRSKVAQRRVKAIRIRTMFYGTATAAVGIGVGLMVWSYKYFWPAALVLTFVAAGLVWEGRRRGEMWRVTVTGERDLFVKTEDRAFMIIKELKEGYKKVLAEEKKQAKQERENRRKRHQEHKAVSGVYSPIIIVVCNHHLMVSGIYLAFVVACAWTARGGAQEVSGRGSGQKDGGRCPAFHDNTNTRCHTA